MAPPVIWQIIRATDGNRRKRLLADCLRLPTLDNFFLTLPAQSPRARLRYNGGAAAPEPGVDRSRIIAAGLTANRYRHVGGEGPGDDSSPLRTPMQRTNSWRSRVPLLNERAHTTNEWQATTGCLHQTNVCGVSLCLGTWRLGTNVRQLSLRERRSRSYTPTHSDRLTFSSQGGRR